MKRIVETNNDLDAERCKEAFRFNKTVTIAGVDTLTNQPVEYVGRVLSVEYSSGRPWRVSIDAVNLD